MYEEVAKLKLKVDKWHALIEATLPIDNPKVTSHYGDAHTIYFYVTQNKEEVARFALSFLHGCKGVLISHSILVNEGFRGLGIGTKIQEINHLVAKDLKASTLLSTVIDNNKPQERAMKGWTKLDSFDNIRTGNTINVFTVKVK